MKLNTGWVPSHKKVWRGVLLLDGMILVVSQGMLSINNILKMQYCGLIGTSFVLAVGLLVIAMGVTQPIDER